MERKISLNDVIDAHNLWALAAKMNWLDKAAKAESLCREYLEWTWGKGCTIEFNYEQLEMRCYGASGEFVRINKKGEVA